MRDRLLWRLLGAQLAVIAIAMAVSGALITGAASHTFTVIMMRYHIDPVAVEAEFVRSTRAALVLSSLAAAGAAMLLGWVLVRRLVRPLDEMMVLAERLAAGDYGRRVEVRGPGETARLAASLNRMADSLQRIERLRRELVANVAHELRTPLSTLRGYLEALRDGIVPVTPGTLRSLHEEALRLVRLVDALHQLSRMDARVSRLRRLPIDVAAMARRVIAEREPEFRARGFAVREVYQAALPDVEGDADLAAQALRNLIDNVLRYAPDGARVLVSASPASDAVETASGSAPAGPGRADAVVVAVENTGEGIAAEDLPHVFERFYRGGKPRSRETGGAGVGLSLVREIAQAHGGEAGAASQDGVTRVWFALAARK